jgi:16S rRNA (guanine(1405)-N(7))-methyltransferase
MTQNDTVNRIIAAIQASKKYQRIDPHLIEKLALQSLQRYPTYKLALKATKTKLHQVGTIYQNDNMPYVDWFHQLEQAHLAADEAQFKKISQSIMQQHVSTRERLPIQTSFYEQIFAHLPPIHSILDVACGLNPLNLPWMPLPAGTPITYYASDIFSDMLTFLNKVFRLRGIQGHATLCDLTQQVPQQTADVAFILKTIPCLEQVHKNIGADLLGTLRTQHLVVSYPTKSISKKDVGMSDFYADQFHNLVKHTAWQTTRLDFENELVFIVNKQPAPRY